MTVRLERSFALLADNIPFMEKKVESFWGFESLGTGSEGLCSAMRKVGREASLEQKTKNSSGITKLCFSKLDSTTQKPHSKEGG